MMGANDVVMTFMAAIERRDMDAAEALMTDDMVFDFVPLGPVHGRTAARKRLEKLWGPIESIEVEYHRTLEDGNVVMHERTDIFFIGGVRGEIPVADVFEVRDGKVTLWRDYFDLGQMTQQMTGA